MRDSGTRVLSPAGMTASLTPPLALAYLRELSLDVRAAVVLDHAGEPLTGDAALAPRVRERLAAPDATPAAGDRLRVARTADGGLIAVIAGDLAILSVLEQDLATAAAALVTRVSDLPGSRDSLS
jgi:hypothetical protein